MTKDGSELQHIGSQHKSKPKMYQSVSSYQVSIQLRPPRPSYPRPLQHTTQHFPAPSSSCLPLACGIAGPPEFLRLCCGPLAGPDSERAWAGTPSRMSMLARVAASKTSSTPVAESAEHSLYARAPICWATRSP
jgi:hypothetical protein